MVEIGIGRRTDMAIALSTAGVEVTATDITRQWVPQGIEFFIDDLTDPTLSRYTGAELVYARRLPEELHRPAATLARQCDTDLYFTTLGFEQPIVPVSRITTPESTWYQIRA